MIMIPGIPGDDQRAQCPRCRRTYTKKYGHACITRKAK